MARVLTTKQQDEADRLAGEYETLRERVINTEYGNRYSSVEIEAWRLELIDLEHAYSQLTGVDMDGRPLDD